MTERNYFILEQLSLIQFVKKGGEKWVTDTVIIIDKHH